MGSRRQARILAFQSLFSYEVNPRSVDDLFTFDWLEKEESADLEPDCLFFAKYLISGTVENLPEIDATITRYLKNWEFERVGRVDLAILRISTFQLLFAKDIPPKVAIDEAIDISKKFATDESYRFINGVLDGIKSGLKG